MSAPLSGGPLARLLDLAAALAARRAAGPEAEALVEALRAEHAGTPLHHRPFVLAAERYGLSAWELDVLVVGLATALDARFGLLWARLQAAGTPGPTVELALGLAGTRGRRPWVVGLGAQGRALVSAWGRGGLGVRGVAGTARAPERSQRWVEHSCGEDGRSLPGRSR
jgi:hypothetical protein